MSSTIASRQNSENNLCRQAAARRVYADAKMVTGVQFFLMLVLPIMGSVFGAWHPGAKSCVAAVAMVAVLLDVALLERFSKTAAAKGSIVARIIRLRRAGNRMESVFCWTQS